MNFADVELLLPLLSSTRFTNSIYLNNVYDGLVNYFNERGLDLFCNYCTSYYNSIIVDIDQMLNSKRNDKITLITIATYANIDSPNEYKIWLNDCKMSNRIDDDTCLNLARILYPFLWLDFVYINNKMYSYCKNSCLKIDFNCGKLNSKIRKLISGEDSVLSNLPLIVYYLRNKINNNSFISDIITELKSLLNRKLNWSDKEDILQKQIEMTYHYQRFNISSFHYEEVNRRIINGSTYQISILEKLNELSDINKIAWRDSICISNSKGIEFVDGSIEDFLFVRIDLVSKSIRMIIEQTNKSIHDVCVNTVLTTMFPDEEEKKLTLNKLSILFKPLLISPKNKLWIYGPCLSGKSYLTKLIKGIFKNTIQDLPCNFEPNTIRMLYDNTNIFVIDLNDENGKYPYYISAFPNKLFIIVSYFPPEINLDTTEVIQLTERLSPINIQPSVESKNVINSFTSLIIKDLF